MMMIGVRRTLMPEKKSHLFFDALSARRYTTSPPDTALTRLECAVAELARTRAIRCQVDIRSPRSGDFGDARRAQFSAQAR